MCDRCPQLEEEIAYLRSELGMVSSEERTDTLARVLHVRPGTAKTLSRLYAAKGRLVSTWALMEATADPATDDCRDVKMISVHIFNMRQALGANTVQTVWGKGYSLTETGMAKVAAILGDAQ